MPTHLLAGNSMYLKVGVDGGNLGGAAGRHADPDDLNGWVRGGLLQGCISRAGLSITRQPAGAAACLQGVGGRAGKDTQFISSFLNCQSTHVVQFKR